VPKDLQINESVDMVSGHRIVSFVLLESLSILSDLRFFFSGAASRVVMKGSRRTVHGSLLMMKSKRKLKPTMLNTG
jgi:hypothetical protein